MKSNIFDALCMAAKIIEQDDIDGIYSATNLVNGNVAFAIITYYRRTKMKSAERINADAFMVKNRDLATIGYHLLNDDPEGVVAELLLAIELIDSDGIESMPEIKKLVTEKIAITLLIAYLRKKAGALEFNPARLGIDDEVKDILVGASLMV